MPTAHLILQQVMSDLFTKHVRHSIVSLLPNGTTHIHALDFFFQFSTPVSRRVQTLQFSPLQVFSHPLHPVSIYWGSHFVSGEQGCRPTHYPRFFLGFRPPLESYLENSAYNLISHPGLSRCSIGTVEGEI